MKKNNITSTLASVLLLLTAALGTTGCTQNDDAPDGASLNSQSITVRIAPKAGFAEGNTQTRGTVNADDGTFAWAAGDVIYVVITFKDESSNILKDQSGNNIPPLYHEWVYTDATNNQSYLGGNWIARLRTDNTTVDKLQWPAGATKAEVKAFYSDAHIAGDDRIPLDYTTAGATGDIMTFNDEISNNEDLVVVLKHDVARLTFTGLAANTGYKLKGVFHIKEYSPALDPTSHESEQTFTSDGDGNLTFCAPLTISDGEASRTVTLQTAATSEDVCIASLPAQGTPLAVNGCMYTLSATSGGGITPDSYEDLLKPKPIIEGNKVWAVNGYWVTAPEEETTKYTWTAIKNNDPCANHGSWRLPTMKDFEKICGFEENNPWSLVYAVTDGLTPIGIPDSDDRNVWNEAFLPENSDGQFWSSNRAEAADGVPQTWYLQTTLSQADYKKASINDEKNVRCVQLK